MAQVLYEHENDPCIVISINMSISSHVPFVPWDIISKTYLHCNMHITYIKVERYA